jgi:hypothetical protein
VRHFGNAFTSLSHLDKSRLRSAEEPCCRSQSITLSCSMRGASGGIFAARLTAPERFRPAPIDFASGEAPSHAAFAWSGFLPPLMMLMDPTS